MTCADVRDAAPAYVLGALDAREEEAVRAHLETCPEAHDELAELSAGAIALLETVPLVEPPAALKGRVMAAAARDLESRPTPLAAPVASRPAEKQTPNERRGIRDAFFGPTRRGLAWAAVAIAAILVLGSWNFLLQTDLADSRSYQAQLEEAFALARQPGAQLALLAPPEGAAGPTGIAVMPPTGEGRLVMKGLTPTTGTQVYEAWAIHEGQAPIPVGGFTVGPDGVGYFDGMPAAGEEPVIVAITLEPAPDATAPSSAPVSLGVAAPVSTPASA